MMSTFGFGQRVEFLFELAGLMGLGELGRDRRRRHEELPYRDDRYTATIASRLSATARCVLPTPGGPSSNTFSPPAIQR